MTIGDLADALRDIAEDNWKKCHKPLLLSELPDELEKRLQGDYKPFLGSESLKSYIKSSGPTNGYRLVEHPTQRAKLGIVPTGVDFEFTANAEVSSALRQLSGQDVQGFARVLRSLTPDELRQLSLPASLVVRLLDSK